MSAPSPESMEGRSLDIEAAEQPAKKSSGGKAQAEKLTPVPVEQLMPGHFIPQAESRKAKKKAMNAKLLTTGGKLKLRLRPSAESAILMAIASPGLLCLPCFSDVSSDVEFDDHYEQVRVRSWPGYLKCLQKTRRIAYRDIANVIILGSHQSRGNKYAARRVYKLCLALRDGTRMCLMMDDLDGVKALAVQVRANTPLMDLTSLWLAHGHAGCTTCFSRPRRSYTPSFSGAASAATSGPSTERSSCQQQIIVAHPRVAAALSRANLDEPKRTKRSYIPESVTCSRMLHVVVG